MSTLLRALSRRIRLALHRHDPIECWCELSAADVPRRLVVLPVHVGDDACPGCWVMPGHTHELSCEQVTPEQFLDFLARSTR